jgi:hypothetical protein
MGFDRGGRGLHISEMAKVDEKRDSRWSSAAIIRELRGPLPEDDPHFELVDGEYVLRKPFELTPAQREAVEGVIRDLQALPKGTILTMDEIAALVARLPGRPKTWTSADVIREARGPLPEDDPDFPDDPDFSA